MVASGGVAHRLIDPRPGLSGPLGELDDHAFINQPEVAVEGVALGVEVQETVLGVAPDRLEERGLGRVGGDEDARRGAVETSRARSHGPQHRLKPID